MRICVSNIAWPAEQDDAVAAELVRLGVTGVEVAPAKLFLRPAEATDEEIDACRARWEARGLPVVAAQALLFGRPDLTLFESPEVRESTFAYLAGVVRTCGRLGAKAMVFGAPKNRRVGGRDRAEAFAEAVAFFGRLAKVAADAGTAVVLEPNPPEYGADFATTAFDAAAVVRAVGHPGFRLVLDSACLLLAGDSPAAVPPVVDLLAHAHASEPDLAPVGGGAVDHAGFAAALRAAGYAGWASAEMREPSPFDRSVLSESVRRVVAAYGDPPG